MSSAPPVLLDTPEHVAVGFELADLGQRAIALITDLAIQGAAIAAVLIGVAWVGGTDDRLLVALAVLISFLVRSFYFTLGEIYGHGRTLGKRLFRLRVVARDGGPLTAAMIFARNLTRELETFLPLSVLLAPTGLIPGAPRWTVVVVVPWVLALTLLPLFNRQRARLGDLLAGTMVVVEPRAVLLPDLADEAEESKVQEEFAFTPGQLELYGIRELQVLESVLRRTPSNDRDRALALICNQVQRKIEWPEDQRQVQPERFLQAFYAAQRGHLEQRMLLGDRRERKVR